MGSQRRRKGFGDEGALTPTGTRQPARVLHPPDSACRSSYIGIAVFTGGLGAVRGAPDARVRLPRQRRQSFCWSTRSQKALVMDELDHYAGWPGQAPAR
jgi:hypothetical protein